MELHAGLALVAILGCCLSATQHMTEAAPAVFTEWSRTTSPATVLTPATATRLSLQQPPAGNWTAEDQDQDQLGVGQRPVSLRSAFVLIASLSAMCMLAIVFLAYGLFSRAEAIKDDDAAAEMDMDQAMFGAHGQDGGGAGFGD